MKIIHVKGTDAATPEDRERYIFKPTFKPLWQKDTSSQVSFVQQLLLFMQPLMQFAYLSFVLLTLSCRIKLSCPNEQAERRAVAYSLLCLLQESSKTCILDFEC